MSANKWANASRLGGLRRFAVAITILNILGHTVLGFEQSWAQPLVAPGTAYGLEFLLELLGAWSAGRTPARTPEMATKTRRISPELETVTNWRRTTMTIAAAPVARNKTAASAPPHQLSAPSPPTSVHA